MAGMLAAAPGTERSPWTDPTEGGRSRGWHARRPDVELLGARLYLSLELNEAIRDGQLYPVLMPLRGNVIRWFARSVLAAVQLAMMLELIGGAPERACAKCGTLFAATRRDREFCSRECKGAARKARVRASTPGRSRRVMAPS